MIRVFATSTNANALSSPKRKERDTDLVVWSVTRQSLRRRIHKWRLAKEEPRTVVSLPRVSREDRRLRLVQMRKTNFEEFPQRKLNHRERNLTRDRREIASIKSEETLKWNTREERHQRERGRLTSLFNADRVIETSESSRLTWARCFINSIGTRRRHAPYPSKTTLPREREEISPTISPLMAATIELAHGEEICSLVRL